MRFCILTSVFCLLASLAHARQPGFDPRDVVRRARPAHAGNPAFDVTPARLISGIITEAGIIRPPYRQNIAKAFRKKRLQLPRKERAEGKLKN